MLQRLLITNIVLVENAEVSFSKGFNVITGETGAGKSALMGALSLLTGQRAATGILRRDAKKGYVEASFDIDTLPLLEQLLQEAGIDHIPGEELIIRREIHSVGKSRAFINNQMVQIAFLHKMGKHLLDILGQHANQKLLETDYHRIVVDLFGDLESDLKAFEESWQEVNRIRKELKVLSNSEANRLREVEICRMELKELEEADVKEDEDEELFRDYTLLSNAEELTQHASELNQLLSGRSPGIVPLLSSHQTILEKLVALAPSLEEAAKAYRNALLEIEEVSETLQRYQSTIEFNPTRMHEINERLSLISRLKRKYGDLQDYQRKVSERLDQLENADNHIEELREKLSKLENENHRLAQLLTTKRKAAASLLEKAVEEHLSSLNMPKAKFHVAITKQDRHRCGDDHIEFFLSPNVGEKQIPIKECASGGELSRVMLVLQTLLAKKEQTPTMVFDEIDANIGGETANVVGEKLKEMGKNHQVLCISHFPQVAKHAQHHLHLSKREESGRTVTHVKVLNAGNREKELARMRGETPTCSIL